MAADPRNWIQGKLFGDPSAKISLNIDNSETGAIYTENGTIYSNNEGEIFVEASGQDYNNKGFVAHRPYISSVYGRKANSTLFSPNLGVGLGGIQLNPDDPNSENINEVPNPFTFYVAGSPSLGSGNINLLLSGSDSDIVYTNVGLFVRNESIASGALSMFISGKYPDEIYSSGFNLFTKCSDPLRFLNIYTAGW